MGRARARAEKVVSKVVTLTSSSHHQRTSKVATDKNSTVAIAKTRDSKVKEVTDPIHVTRINTAVRRINSETKVTEDRRKVAHMVVTAVIKDPEHMDDHRSRVLMEDNLKEAPTGDIKKQAPMEDIKKRAPMEDHKRRALTADIRRRVPMGDRRNQVLTVDPKDRARTEVTAVKDLVHDPFHLQLGRGGRGNAMPARSNLQDQTRGGIVSQLQRK